MSAVPCVEIKGLGKRFGLHWVLHGVDLTVQAGETVALFGNNGSGKSTLLKILATLFSATAGTLKVHGFDVRTQKAEVRERVRLLAHEKQLYGSLTVLENLRLAAELRGCFVSENEQELEVLLERLYITRYKHSKVAELSEGTKKRLMIARMLLGDAKLILLDEPHPTLDQHSKAILNELIFDWQQKGKTILLASHDHEQTLAHADRVIVLENGRVRDEVRAL